MTFPRAASTQPSREPYRASDLINLLSAVPKTGPTEAHLCALNVRTTEDVPLEDIVPQAYLPSPEIDDEACHHPTYRDICTEAASHVSNKGCVPATEDFLKRAGDLILNNDDVFRYLEQRPNSSRKIVKVSWFRKFWDKLLLVAEHWDTTTDETYGESDPITGKTYIGRRVFKGEDMPLMYLEDTVKEFAEAIAWARNCRYIRPSTQSRLEVGNMRLLVPQSAAIYRTPCDRDEARKGFAEGPLIGVFVTANPAFSPQTETTMFGASQIVLKEISLAMMLAQKRSRQGQKEVPVGCGKWWAETPRWGGGTGGQIGILEQSVNHFRDSDTARKARDLAAKRYKQLRTPCSTWDRGINYQQIGKSKGAIHDDIYVISAMNHHVSIVRVRIPDRYLQNLTVGTDEILDEPLIFQRSLWFDLLTPDGRLQAMRGVWGALGWLLRRESEVNAGA